MLKDIAALTGRQCSIGALYTTLDRLEDKGFIKTWMGEPSPERGGRAKRMVRITAKGLREAQAFYEAVMRVSLGASWAPRESTEAALKNQSSRPEAPPFSLVDASGKTQKLTDYRGKVVLWNFWATDCGGCRLEIPWLTDIDQTSKNKRVVVIGISMDISYEGLKSAAEAWAKAKPFVSAHQIRYLVLMEDPEVTKRYDIQALPVTYLIDPRGRIAATYLGLIDKQNVESSIDALLAEHQ